MVGEEKSLRHLSTWYSSCSYRAPVVHAVQHCVHMWNCAIAARSGSIDAWEFEGHLGEVDGSEEVVQ